MPTASTRTSPSDQRLVLETLSVDSGNIGPGVVDVIVVVERIVNVGLRQVGAFEVCERAAAFAEQSVVSLL